MSAADLIKLNLGCGTNILPGWTNCDLAPQSNDVVLLDLRMKLPWGDGTVSHILLEHVLEHGDSAFGFRVLSECYRVLAPNGVLRVCVPDVQRVEARQTEEYKAFYRSRWGMDPIASLACQHGHGMLWNMKNLSPVLGCIGYNTIRMEFPGYSRHPELRNVDGHGKVIGDAFNTIETLCVEAAKL